MEYATRENDVIKVNDLYFKKYIDHQKILDTVERLAAQIHDQYKGDVPVFISILNGAFMFSADLLKYYMGVCQITFLKLSSYTGTSTRGEVDTLIGLNDDIKNRHVVILEDIIDSGITVKYLLSDLTRYQPKSLKVATLLLKPEALQTEVKPDFIGLEIPKDFIVGYGLDYNGYGRNLKDIYKITDDPNA